MTLKVLADCHHFDLYYSLQLLFEKRLGWELYRPIGLDWWHEKYWCVYPHVNTAQQYLGTEQHIEIPKDIHGFALPERLCLNKNYRFEDGIYYVNDPTKDKIQRGITLEKFKNTKFDILVSSIPQHINTWNRLISECQPQAKHIFQVGNAWGHQPGVRNILASTAPFPVPPGINICFYRQEFDLDTFYYEPPDTSNKNIFSFIHYMREIELYNAYKQSMPDYTFCSHGAGMDKDICRSSDLANRIRETSFIWHVKPEADGFGHVAHNAYACGRPLITKTRHYQGKIASALMEDGTTCIDIGKYSLQEGTSKIREASKPENLLKMSENSYKRFKEVVNFDKEFEGIKKFLERLA